MRNNYLLFGIFTSLVMADAFAVNFPTQPNMPLSQYGMIQNVQNYSSNPFYNPDGPYNQRFPVPVYATGADLTAADCQSAVTQIVANVCGMRNNCAGQTISDVRPTITVQLSQMSGANYATSCAGFVDGAFNDYIARYGTAVMPTGFPTAINPGNNTGGNDFKIANPYAIQAPEWSGDQWFQGIVDRTVELNQLQAQNGAGTEKLVATQMPKTYNDLSFTDRMANAAAGYEQWAGTNAYQRVTIQDNKDALQAKLEKVQLQQQICMAAQGMGNINLDTLNADIAALQKCKAENKKLSECKLRGNY